MGQAHSAQRTFDFCGKEITITEGTDHLGAILAGAQLAHVTWGGSIFVSKVLESRHRADRSLEGKRVLEIGSGTGLAACVCAILGATVVATEKEETLEMLRQNVASNGLAGSVEVHALNWFAEPEERPVFCGGLPFDLIITADCTYSADTKLTQVCTVCPQLLSALNCCWP